MNDAPLVRVHRAQLERLPVLPDPLRAPPGALRDFPFAASTVISAVHEKARLRAEPFLQQLAEDELEGLEQLAAPLEEKVFIRPAEVDDAGFLLDAHLSRHLKAGRLHEEAHVGADLLEPVLLAHGSLTPP